MKRKLTQLLILSCLLAASGLNSIAQEKKRRPDESRPQKPGTGEKVTWVVDTFKVLAEKSASRKVVKDAPYSATAVTETIQTLSDGNQIIRKNESKLYRDSEGRTRIEQTLETIGKWSADGKAQQRIFINDPNAGKSYSIDPRTREAIINVIVSKKPPTGAQSDTRMVNGQKVTTYTINSKTATQAEYEAHTAASGKKPRPEGELPVRPRKEISNDPVIDTGQKKTESLGTRTIEGVTAEGTRSTLTIPAGEIGNTLPIEIVDETWYSPELQITIMTKHRDPRSGETTYRLTNINRSEPDRSLFEIPDDHPIRGNKMPLKPKPIKEEQ